MCSNIRHCADTLAAGASVLITLAATAAHSPCSYRLVPTRAVIGPWWPLHHWRVRRSPVPTPGLGRGVPPGASVMTSALAVVAATAAALIAGGPWHCPIYAALAAILAAIFVGVAARAAGAAPSRGSPSRSPRRW